MITQLLINILIVTILPFLIAYFWERHGSYERSRKSYALRVLGTIIITIAIISALANFMDHPFQSHIKEGITAIGNLFIFKWAYQRIRDCGLPAKYFWLLILPLLNLIFIIALMTLPKKRQANSEYRI